MADATDVTATFACDEEAGENYAVNAANAWRKAARQAGLRIAEEDDTANLDPECWIVDRVRIQNRWYDIECSKTDDGTVFATPSPVEPVSEDDVAEELGEEYSEQQIAQITTEYRQIVDMLQLVTRIERDTYFTAVVERVTGTLNPIARLNTAKKAEHEAAEARRAVRAGAVADAIAGHSEEQVARRYNVTRMTVRSWLGK